MRCEDVIRELALRGRGGDAAIGQHLDTCNACAEWSAQMVDWDRLWDITRPVEPTPATWDAVWNRLESALDSQAGPGHIADAGMLTPSPLTPLRVAAFPTAPKASRNFQPAEVQTGILTNEVGWITASPSRLQQIFFLASAAALLIGLGLPWLASRVRQDDHTIARISVPGGPIAPSIHPEVASVDIGEGEMVLIQSSDPAGSELARVVEVTKFEPEDGIDNWFVMFGAIESMANPVIAAR